MDDSEFTIQIPDKDSYYTLTDAILKMADAMDTIATSGIKVQIDITPSMSINQYPRDGNMVDALFALAEALKSRK